jgi:hypothetical protein
MNYKRVFIPLAAATLFAVLPVTVTLAQQGDTGSLTEPSSEPSSAH